ncbi:FMN-binding negative transcriptional regulator [Beutenbergia cavernae DSM 12333]|uniref:FMN-binding negative transcriptional regulator n=1 Tax=Beutenbergia cavernae (strain ATCC BAA-8 / DSM 12333 / CCUG 43141 / JCM 11478 / NBRC 16432 / NCIMB 13614 / HKI 0122) TaxID=471853 RepID=C5C3J4_BEUC1|nr:FMN-binding negative transcriptional regulator [Beutenbergia cavernae]ACQ81903.1 FMN-binding negative transcriptional regulator [Beutenbergia cavernae DSM 12333]
MLDGVDHRVTDVAWARALVRRVGWGTLVSTTSTSPPSPVASHLPLLLDPGAGELAVLSHLGRPDDVTHELADAARMGREVLVTVEGPSGYVSPSWYSWGPAVPTWNFLAVHLWGVPEILSASDTFDVLRATVARFEDERPSPWVLPDDGDGGAYARRLAPGTLGFRVRATRWQGKAKLSQDKPPEVVARVIAALESDPVHGNAALAAAMRDVHGSSASTGLEATRGRSVAAEVTDDPHRGDGSS